MSRLFGWVPSCAHVGGQLNDVVRHVCFKHEGKQTMHHGDDGVYAQLCTGFTGKGQVLTVRFVHASRVICKVMHECKF
jgi:hypothetical protein